ncbi:MAG: DUF1847 domain-containing protein [Rhodospirillales bacterium]|jgi:uncharacterized metal-binding protein|nr:DUF1847 domain-containing protein [Rhodospirillales bacterium]
MAYENPSCAYCPAEIRACRDGEPERGPGWCPSKVDDEGISEGIAKYEDADLARTARESAKVEAEGYCEWTRVEEVCVFAKRMEYHKIGIAFCIGFIDMANTLSQVLESHGFEVASVCCKAGGVAKEDIGLKDSEKIRPGNYEAMCNPITQAQLLNRSGTDFNVVLGLCVGHDSLFFKHSEALVTTLVAKDRVLAHNPAAALLLADGYYKKIWGPHRPETPPKKPAEGRKQNT